MALRRRQVYLIVLLLALPTIVLVWLTNPQAAFIQWTYPLLALYLLIVIAALLTRQSFRRLESLTFWVFTTTWFGMMLYELYFTPDLVLVWQRLSPTVFMGFVLLCIMAHILYPTRTGLRTALFILLVSSLLGFTRFVPELLTGQHASLFVDLVRYQVQLAVAILFLYVLARGKEAQAAMQQEAERMKEIAYQDALTGLPNRRHLEDELERQHVNAIRYKRPYSLILFDLDHFKQVNDHHGHPVGDEVLRAMADLINPLLRQGDLFGRWGGEEFLILVPETTQEAALALANRLRQSISAHLFPHNLHVTASFGVSSYKAGLSRQILLERVDALLYLAKRTGRNRVFGERQTLTDH